MITLNGSPTRTSFFSERIARTNGESFVIFIGMTFWINLCIFVHFWKKIKLFQHYKAMTLLSLYLFIWERCKGKPYELRCDLCRKYLYCGHQYMEWKHSLLQQYLNWNYVLKIREVYCHDFIQANLYRMNDSLSLNQFTMGITDAYCIAPFELINNYPILLVIAMENNGTAWALY